MRKLARGVFTGLSAIMLVVTALGVLSLMTGILADLVLAPFRQVLSLERLNIDIHLVSHSSPVWCVPSSSMQRGHWRNTNAPPQAKSAVIM